MKRVVLVVGRFFRTKGEEGWADIYSISEPTTQLPTWHHQICKVWWTSHAPHVFLRCTYVKQGLSDHVVEQCPRLIPSCKLRVSHKSCPTIY